MLRSTAAKRDRRLTLAIHKFFWRANLQSKPTLLFAYATRIPAYAALNTFIPLASAYGIQAVLNHQSWQVLKYALYVILLGLVYAVLSGIGNVSVSRNAIRGSAYIQRSIFSNYLSKDYEFYSNAYFGALGAKAVGMRDAYNDYGEMVTQAVPKQLTIIVTSVIIVASQSLWLAVITLIAMAVVLGFTLAAGAYRVRFRRQVSEASSLVAAHIGDSLSHAAAVKSFAMEAEETKRLQKPLGTWMHAQYRAWVSNVIPDGVRMILASVATALLLLSSAYLYNRHEISVSLVILVQLYVIRLVASTLDIAEIVKRYEQILSRAYDAMNTMLIAPTIADKRRTRRLPAGKKHALQLDDISYRYDEAGVNRYAIRNLSLNIRPGEKIGLVGYSGSGKTTLTKLLLRFMDVQDGSIRLDGVDLRDLKQADVRHIISYVPQEPLLFHRTIADNIAYGRPGASDKDIKRAAKLAYVSEFVGELPKGYDTFVGERGVKLSGGQRQRVAIARALLKDAPILVLDEATSSLDSQSEKYIQEALWRLLENRTAIVIAHRLSTVQRMDRIVVMDKGRIVQQGTHKELVSDKRGVYARLWSHQSGGYLGTNGSN